MLKDTYKLLYLIQHVFQCICKYNKYSKCQCLLDYNSLIH